MTTLPERACCGTDFILKDHAFHFHPVNGIECARGEVTHESGIAFIMAAVHSLFKEVASRVFNTLLTLAKRIRCIECTFTHVCRTA